MVYQRRRLIGIIGIVAVLGVASTACAPISPPAPPTCPSGQLSVTGIQLVWEYVGWGSYTGYLDMTVRNDTNTTVDKSIGSASVRAYVPEQRDATVFATSDAFDPNLSPGQSAVWRGYATSAYGYTFPSYQNAISWQLANTYAYWASGVNVDIRCANWSGPSISQSNSAPITTTTTAVSTTSSSTTTTTSIPPPLPVAANYPSWSPDGTKIAYSAAQSQSNPRQDLWNWDIYSMGIDGSGQTKLTDFDGVDLQPSWSPDGTKIAFSRVDSDNYDIYVMDANGANQTRITTDPSCEHSPSWSPDGTKIAFISGICTGDNPSIEIYVMDANGANQTKITNDPACCAFAPKWSPDGTKIVFQRSARDLGTSVFVMDTNGANLVRLTDPGETNSWPAWSPDGTKIVYAHYTFPVCAGPVCNGKSEIYVMDANGANPVRLTEGKVDTFVVWSPNGTKIAFSRYGANSIEAIYTMDASGANQIQLPVSIP